MSLSDLASLGSFVSGIAVLASLVFLFFQMRQMTEQARQSEKNQQSLIQIRRITRLIDMVYRRLDPHLNDVFLRGRRGDTSLAPDQVETYLQVSYAGLLAFEDTYLQVHAGMLDPKAWETAVARLKQATAAPGYRVAWTKHRARFDSDFVEAVDRIVARSRLSAWKEPSASWISDLAEENRLTAN